MRFWQKALGVNGLDKVLLKPVLLPWLILFIFTLGSNFSFCPLFSQAYGSFSAVKSCIWGKQSANLFPAPVGPTAHWERMEDYDPWICASSASIWRLLLNELSRAVCILLSYFVVIRRTTQVKYILDNTLQRISVLLKGSVPNEYGVLTVDRTNSAVYLLSLLTDWEAC